MTKNLVYQKYQNQIGIWYMCPKFLGMFFVFYQYFENALVKIWLNVGIFLENKSRFGIWFLHGCHFIGISLVLVCHFPENDISI